MAIAHLQIVIALIFAVGLGTLLGAGQPNPDNIPLIKHLAIPCDLILKALRALAPPLILLAVLHSFLTADIPGKAGRRLRLSKSKIQNGITCGEFCPRDQVVSFIKRIKEGDKYYIYLASLFELMVKHLFVPLLIVEKNS